MAASSSAWSSCLLDENVRIVGWVNRAEWEYVYENLYGDDVQQLNKALDRLAAWKSRLLVKMPIAVECTSDLMNAVLKDKLQTCENTEQLRLLYSLAVVRFVNLVTDGDQIKTLMRPVHVVADELGIPEWLVNLRHEATHGSSLPSLQTLRTGARFALSWLRLQYWEEMQRPPVDNNRLDQARQFLTDYMQERFEALGTSKRKSKGINLPELDQLKDLLKEVIQVFLEDGYLLATPQQLLALSAHLPESDDGVPEIPSSLLVLWKPVLQLLKTRSLLENLLKCLLVDLANNTRGQNSLRARLTAAWVVTLIGHGQSQSTGTRKGFNWRNLLDTALENPNCYTALILKRLLPLVEPRVSAPTQSKLIQLAQIYSLRATGSSSKTGDAGAGTSAARSRPVRALPTPVARVYSVEELLKDLAVVHADDVSAALSLAGSRGGGGATKRSASSSTWKLCQDSTPWVEYPLGVLPHQAPVHPRHFEIAVSQDPRPPAPAPTAEEEAADKEGAEDHHNKRRRTDEIDTEDENRAKEGDSFVEETAQLFSDDEIEVCQPAIQLL